jgi:hypothetical protein
LRRARAADSQFEIIEPQWVRRKFYPEVVLAVFLAAFRDCIFEVCLGFSWEFLLNWPVDTL